jgi:hypothetical protein
MVFLWFLSGLGIGLAQAQRPKPAIARAPPSTMVYARSEARVPLITFFTVANGAPVQSAGLDQGTLNLGILSNTTRTDEEVQIQPQKGSFVVATRVGLRVDLANSGRGGTATVSAYLLSPDPQRTVWLDGVQLSLTPGIIARHMSYGATTEHVLKIVVPASVPPGQLLDLIGVIVTPN